ncbi:arsenate reductase family protein [Flavobacterium sp.]|uniref:arsenate reductase family protein n=1 Tax=Flavobacterium sp. TaxID=239 RepID=UPI0040479A14
MIFANTDKEITLIYNSEEHIGKQILAFAKIEKLPIHDIDLAHMKVTTTQWAELASRMGIAVSDLVNTQGADFSQKFAHSDAFSDDDWLTLLVHNPGVLKAPIVMKGDKIVMMTNAQDMLHFVK